MSTAAASADAPASSDTPGLRVHPGAGTALHRLVLSCLSLAALVVGVVGVLTGAEGLRAAGLLVFALLGVGAAPWQLNAGLPLAERLVFSGLTSLGVLTLPSVAMVATESWHPALAAVVVAVVCVPLHVLGGWRALTTLRSAQARTEPTPGGGSRLARWAPPSLIAAVVGALLCLVAALTHRQETPDFWGFLPHIGVAWYVGLTLVVLGIVGAGLGAERFMAVPVVLLAEVLTLTPAIVYAGARSQSTLKHVELVQMVREGGGLHSAVDAYNAWSGFFASMAWLCDVVGVRDPLTLALFWPPLLGLLRVVALRHLFGQLLPSSYQRWVAVTLAVLVDAIGADYFSPQSVGFVLGLIAFGVALSPTSLRLRAGMLLLAGCTVATSHQLSPFIIGGVMVLLVVFRQVRPWWLPLCVLVPAGLWTVTHLGSVSGFLSPELLGRLSNFQPPKTVASAGLAREPIIGTTTQALMAGILLIGLLALVTLVRERRTARAWALALAPGVGLALVAINPYGQEAIFRAALFGLPWLVALAVAVFPRPRRLVDRTAFLAAAGVLTATFLVASFALDAFTVTRPADVAAVRYPQQHGHASHITVLMGAGDLPDTVRPGEIVTVPGQLDIGSGDVQGRSSTIDQLPPDQEVTRINDLLWQRYLADASGTRPAVYALWSPVQSVYQQAYGLQAPERFAQLRSAFAASPYWRQVLQQDGTVLFEFDQDAYAAGLG